jgi:predicted aspartyl protease
VALRFPPGLRAAALLLALAVAACAPLQPESSPPQQPAGCRVTLAADLPATIAQNTLVVEATAGAHPLRLLVDTGASGGGALSGEVVRRLGLVPVQGAATVTTIAGFMAQSQRVRVAELRLGDLPPVETVMAVMPPEAAGILSGRADGLLGAAILSRHDVEIDPGSGRLRFHTVQGCTGELVPFSEPYQALPLRFGPTGQIYVPLRIDGTELLALVDTGYNGEVLILPPGAERLGMGGDGANDLARGVGRDFTGQAVPVRVRRVGSIALGTLVAQNAPVTVLMPQANGAPVFVSEDALLGGAFLLRRRVWISYATGRLYVAHRVSASR